METRDIEEFWKGCMRLKFLTVSELKVDGVFFGSHLGYFPNLEFVELGTSEDSLQVDQILVLKRCPNLRQLSICDDMCDYLTIPTLTSILLGGHLPCLEFLTIINPTTQFKDAEMSLCLQAMTRVKGVVAIENNFGSLSLNSLEPHFGHLQQLALDGCDSFTGAMVQLVLESCPLLRAVRAPRIEASLILKGKRWACLDLCSFFVTIVLDSDELSVGCQSRMVYVQLARLTQLEILDIRAHGQKRIQSLDLRLESGLFQLSSLKSLRRLFYAGTIQYIAMEDVQWMRQHWQLQTHPIPLEKKRLHHQK